MDDLQRHNAAKVFAMIVDDVAVQEGADRDNEELASGAASASALRSLAPASRRAR